MKVLEGVFSVIVKTDGSFATLIIPHTAQVPAPPPRPDLRARGGLRDRTQLWVGPRL